MLSSQESRDFSRERFKLRLESEGLAGETPTETSAEIRERTTSARIIQHDRYKGNGLNGTIAFTEIMSHAQLTKAQEATIKQVCFEKKWSNRTYTKVIRMARTIADLAGVSTMTDQAIKWKIRTANFQNETESARMTNG